GAQAQPVRPRWPMLRQRRQRPPTNASGPDHCAGGWPRKAGRPAAPQARQHPAVSDERISVRPEPTPEEAEAIRQALEVLGLIEPAPAGGAVPTGDADREP